MSELRYYVEPIFNLIDKNKVDHYRITDRFGDNRIATCYDIQNANTVVNALNKQDTGADCPTCWYDGWDACHKRFVDILKRFPLQCAMISQRLPLHPVQPDKLLEPDDWLMAQGVNPRKGE